MVAVYLPAFGVQFWPFNIPNTKQQSPVHLPSYHSTKSDGRPWCRRGRRSMEDTKKKMKCSRNEDKSKKSSRQWRFFVKMKGRSEAMVWKVARGDEGEG